MLLRLTAVLLRLTTVLLRIHRRVAAAVVLLQPTPVRTGLRCFRVIFDGVLSNCVVITSVTFAMAKTLTILLGLSAIWSKITLVLLGGGHTPSPPLPPEFSRPAHPARTPSRLRRTG